MSLSDNYPNKLELDVQVSQKIVNMKKKESIFIKNENK